MTYKRDTAFSDVKDAQLGQKLDQELDIVGNKMGEIHKRLDAIVNDDGSLKRIVDVNSLKGELSLGAGQAEDWKPGKKYEANQMVLVDLAILMATQPHISSPEFKKDVDKWRMILNFAPYVEKVARLASAPHVKRVDAHLDTLLSLSEQTGKLVELSSHIDKLVALSSRLPDLDKFLADDGNVVLQDVYKAIPAINAILEFEQDIFNVSRSRAQIAELSKIGPEMKKLADAFEDIRIASKAIKSLKEIAGSVNKISGG